jgi:hypothetical protein
VKSGEVQAKLNEKIISGEIVVGDALQNKKE